MLHNLIITGISIFKRLELIEAVNFYNDIFQGQRSRILKHVKDAMLHNQG